MNEAIPPPVDLLQISAWLKVLAEPNRLHLFHRIMEGYQCNCILGSDLDIPPNLVSYHLRTLHKAGLVEMQRDPVDARWVYYSVNRAALDELNQALGSFFDPERIQARQDDLRAAGIDPSARGDQDRLNFLPR